MYVRTEELTSQVFRLPTLFKYIESIIGAQISFMENGMETIEKRDKLA